MEVEAEAEAILCHFMWKRKRLKKKFLNLEAEAEAIEKKFPVFEVEAEAMKDFAIKWKRKRKLWNFFSQNGSGSGSAIKIYRFQNADSNSSSNNNNNNVDDGKKSHRLNPWYLISRACHMRSTLSKKSLWLNFIDEEKNHAHTDVFKKWMTKKKWAIWTVFTRFEGLTFKKRKAIQNKSFFDHFLLWELGLNKNLHSWLKHSIHQSTIFAQPLYFQFI